MIELKRCSKCGEEKAATPDVFYARRNRKAHLSSWCRACHNAYLADRRAAKRALLPQPEALHEGQKRCTRCKEIKPGTPDFFYSSKHGKNGLHPYCKECFKETTRQRRANDPNKSKEISRRAYYKNHEANKAALRASYRKRIADPGTKKRERESSRKRAALYRLQSPECHRQAVRNYRARNPQLVRQQNKFHKAEAYRKNPEIFIARSAAQRARRVKAEGSFCGSDVRDLFARQEGCCFYCGTKITWRKVPWAVDHFIPISRGGSNNPDNLVVACQSCNARKHNKMPWEWMPDRFSPPPVN